MITVDMTSEIRRKVVREGKSIRSVAKDMGLSRHTVTKYAKAAAVAPYDHRNWKRVVSVCPETSHPAGI